MSDFASYKNKRVVVSGCFSGMGEATARLLLEQGAEVHGFDVAETKLNLASFQKLDLRDPATIDAGIGKLEGKFDALFNCSGVSGAFAQNDVMKINYAGTRHLTELVLPKIKDGGSISSISSTAAFAWGSKIAPTLEFVKVEGFDNIVKYYEEKLSDGTNAYPASKEALIIWTLKMSAKLIKERGIRVNCILPGPTQTPFMTAQSKITPDAMMDVFTLPINRRSTAEEQAAALVFLGSDAASYINGVALPVDGGFMGALTAGELDLQAEFGKVMGAMKK